MFKPSRRNQKVSRTVNLRISIALWLVLIAGCTTVSQEGVQSVSIAPDDQSFVVDYQSGDESLIAIIATDGYIPRVLLRSDGKFDYQRPVFSRDGDKVFFIRSEKRDRGDLYVIDVDGENQRPITTGQEGAENIQDIAVSSDPETIYFINSGFYGHYSPIAASGPHQMDFFAIKEDGTDLERLSYSNTYSISGISIAPSADKIYFRGGVLHLRKPPYYSEFKVSAFIAFSSRYPLSEFTDSGKVVLAAGKIEERKSGPFDSREEIEIRDFSAVYGYGLFLVDVNNDAVKEIVHLHSYLDSPAIFHNQQRVLFIRNDSIFGGEAGAELWAIDIDGSNLHKIDLTFFDGMD